jgi:hypothetical protein
MNINESELRNYIDAVVKNLLEDVFDSAQSAAASRANVKKARRILGPRSPHTKELEDLHNAIVGSENYYGISDREMERRAGGTDMDERPARKPTLTRIKPKAYDGYDAIYGVRERGLNLGAIGRAAAAIRASTRTTGKKGKKGVPPPRMLGGSMFRKKRT